MTNQSDLPETCILVLFSGVGGNRKQTADTDMCQTILRGQGVHPEVLDAADPDNKDFRNELFDISGIRGNYPQVFKIDEGEITFVGDFAAIEAMNEQGEIAALLGEDEEDEEEESEEEEETEEEGEEESEEEGEESVEETDDEEEESDEEEETDDENELADVDLDTDEEEAKGGEVQAEEEKKKPGFFAAMFGKKKKEDTPEVATDDNAERGVADTADIDEEAPQADTGEVTQNAVEDKPKKKGLFASMFGKMKQEEVVDENDTGDVKEGTDDAKENVLGADNIVDPDDLEADTKEEPPITASRDVQSAQVSQASFYDLLIKVFTIGACVFFCLVIVLLILIILD